MEIIAGTIISIEMFKYIILFRERDDDAYNGLKQETELSLFLVLQRLMNHMCQPLHDQRRRMLVLKFSKRRLLSSPVIAQVVI